MLDSLRFVKYVRSFMDGRVRVRHPAPARRRHRRQGPRRPPACGRCAGHRAQPLSGSALILYDSTRLSQDRLIETGCRWADWLDKAARGQAGRCRPCRNDRHSGERLFANKSSLPGPFSPKTFQVRAQVPVAAS